MSEWTESLQTIQPSGLVKTQLGTATELSITVFLDRVLPPLKDGVNVKNIAEKLACADERSPCEPIIIAGRWRGFAQDPAKMECCGNLAFSSLPDTISAIIKASSSDMQMSAPGVYFRNDPSSVISSNSSTQGELPDAYLLCAERVIWSNIIASGEYRKTDTKMDREDVSRVLYQSCGR